MHPIACSMLSAHTRAAEAGLREAFFPSFTVAEALLNSNLHDDGFRGSGSLSRFLDTTRLHADVTWLRDTVHDKHARLGRATDLDRSNQLLLRRSRSVNVLAGRGTST